jgi:hypothetical protein
MKNVCSGALVEKECAASPNFTPGKLVTRVAPHIPTALCLLGYAFGGIGIIGFVREIVLSGLWRFSLLVPWALGGFICFCIGMMIAVRRNYYKMLL